MRAVDLRVRVLVFSVLFSTGMWLSKVAQPLYFDANGAITAFGIGYAVMAIAGGLSFVWGVIADRVGGLTVVTVGCVIYARSVCSDESIPMRCRPRCSGRLPGRALRW